MKIQLPNNIIKKVKPPLSYEALFVQISSLASAKGFDKNQLTIRYVDLDGESVIIEDDADLEMAYTCAFSNDKRIKLIIDVMQ